MQGIQTIEFVKVVNNNVMHIGINCHAQFIHALVVAVHHATAARYTGI